MCLTTVTKTYKENDKMIVGYKLYENRIGRLYDFYLFNERRKGIHYKAKGKYIYDIDVNIEYESGFHILTSLKEAMKFANIFTYPHISLYEVLAWDIRAEGKQKLDTDSYNCVIAKNIRLMKEIKHYKKVEIYYGER